jgi:hypothetical protein
METGTGPVRLLAAQLKTGSRRTSTGKGADLGKTAIMNQHVLLGKLGNHLTPSDSMRLTAYTKDVDVACLHAITACLVELTPRRV